MGSLEHFALKIKPAMDAFLRNANKQNLKILENELSKFDWMHMNILSVNILVPLVLKLEELNNDNEDLRTGCLHCITLVTSKIYLKELSALRTMLIVTLRQVRESDKVSIKLNLSEEIKLAVVKCIMECFKRSTSDVLEQFYIRDSVMILGQILLTLVEFIEKEKYKKLILCSLECLMVVFYVHGEADGMDIVLRNQVANTIFIFLPKVITLLYKIAIADDTLGETIKITSIQAMGRILCLIYEETSENYIHAKYDVDDFKRLLNESLVHSEYRNTDTETLNYKMNREKLEKCMNKLQRDGRTQEWIKATSPKLRTIFKQISKLRSHSSTKIREKYAEMCCLLIKNCQYNLKENFVFMLESIVALSEDENVHIRSFCFNCLQELQNQSKEDIFDETFELLLDEHISKLPRIIARCDDEEQYSELLFLKGFLRMLSSTKLQLYLSTPHNLEVFCMCLLSALDLQTNSDFLIEEYSLRERNMEGEYLGSSDLPWRKFKNLNSVRTVQCLHEICSILGKTPTLNRILVYYFMDMLQYQNAVINEINLILLWLITSEVKNNQCEEEVSKLFKLFVDELLDDRHWYLALEPDKVTQFEVKRHSDWFTDCTPGLYESSIEIRTQDFDSDDEIEGLMQKSQKVTVNDAKFNVLHTCIILDCLGHCALYVGEKFDAYVFQSLHKVLSKLAHSNTLVYKAANFALVSMQKSLNRRDSVHLIEGYIDYITYHLNRLLKKETETKFAIDILTVVLQYSSRNSLHHLEVIFETIHDVCLKYDTACNALSYLKVFNALLNYIKSWLLSCNLEIKDVQKIYNGVKKSKINLNGSVALASWLDILNTTKREKELDEDVAMALSDKLDIKQECAPNTEEKDDELPRHIMLIKSILLQVINFLSSSDLKLQISSLECLTCGISLLHDYENVLLPLVHSTWPLLVEKFRQKNALVLNRCFSLLEVLAINAKDFITKRCLNDVIPFLKNFLQEASTHSLREAITVPTQEVKLQLKLLQKFPTVIECLDLDGKYLSEISEIVAKYLSEEQPIDLQNLAIDYFIKLWHYNGPLIYLVVIKRSYLKKYENNIEKILKSLDIKLKLK